MLAARRTIRNWFVSVCKGFLCDQAIAGGQALPAFPLTAGFDRPRGTRGGSGPAAATHSPGHVQPAGQPRPGRALRRAGRSTGPAARRRAQASANRGARVNDARYARSRQLQRTLRSCQNESCGQGAACADGRGEGGAANWGTCRGHHRSGARERGTAGNGRYTAKTPGCAGVRQASRSPSVAALTCCRVATRPQNMCCGRSRRTGRLKRAVAVAVSGTLAHALKPLSSPAVTWRAQAAAATQPAKRALRRAGGPPL